MSKEKFIKTEVILNKETGQISYLKDGIYQEFTKERLHNIIRHCANTLDMYNNINLTDRQIVFDNIDYRKDGITLEQI